MINSQTKQFEQDLINLINNENLPIANIYYVIKNIFQQLESLYNQQIQQELEEKKDEHPNPQVAAIKKNSDNINNTEEIKQADE